MTNKPVRELIRKQFLKEIDENLVTFCRQIRKELRDEKDSVIGITGYPGNGKSVLAAIIALLIDYEYKFEDICFIPTSKEIENTYMKLPMYSILHIDEASRGLHKQKWYDKVQQKLNQLYDTEREGHYLCTLLLMPRFQNFTENFRNFRIKYWINVVERGIAVVYKRDEDKDAKDPWHLDENYRLKQKAWGNKRIFERELPEIIRKEQRTKNYWFYFRFPKFDDDVWEVYQKLKAESRVISKDADLEVESYKEKLDREKMERWSKIKELKSKGHTHEEIGALVGCSAQTVRRSLRSMEAYERMKGSIQPSPTEIDTNNIIYTKRNDKKNKIPDEFNKINEL